MSKKQKRQVSHRVGTPTTTPAAPKAERPTLVAEFNPDYSYIIQDLKKIGILGGGLCLILVVLSFFIK